MRWEVDGHCTSVDDPSQDEFDSRPRNITLPEFFTDTGSLQNRPS